MKNFNKVIATILVMVFFNTASADSDSSRLDSRLHKQASESNYHDGELHGVYSEWYKNGKKKSEINYKNGKKHGLETKFYITGKKKSEVSYNEGKKQGKEKLWHNWLDSIL